MGTVKAKQIKRDWVRLPAPLQKKQLYTRAVKSRPCSVCLCAS